MLGSKMHGSIASDVEAARIKETKQKLSKNLLSAHRTGELQAVLDTFEEQVQDSVDFAAAEAARIKETKKKLSKNLLSAHRTGELQAVIGTFDEQQPDPVEITAAEVEIALEADLGKPDASVAVCC